MKPDISPKHIRGNYYDMMCPNSGTATTLGMALCYSRVVDSLLGRYQVMLCETIGPGC